MGKKILINFAKEHKVSYIVGVIFMLLTSYIQTLFPKVLGNIIDILKVDNFDPKSEDLTPSKMFEIYKKGFKYLLLGEKNEGGVLCDEVDLVPEKKDAQYFKIKMMISKKDKSVQSWTMFDRSGNRYKNTITKFVPNSKADDAFFTFDPKKYPGVEVIDLR